MDTIIRIVINCFINIIKYHCIFKDYPINEHFLTENETQLLFYSAIRESKQALKKLKSQFNIKKELQARIININI